MGSGRMTPRSSAPVESRVRGNAHARFGGRAGETDPPQGGHRASARPYSNAWMARFRRLARDYERLPETLAGLHFLAFAILMLARFTAILAQNA
jgi:hypothetical protein